MGRPKTTDLKCPFCAAVIFRLDENGCIDDDLIGSSGCPHYAGNIDDYCDGPRPGFEPIIEGYRLWQRVEEEGWTRTDVRAALAGHVEALALLRRLNASCSDAPERWLRRIPGVKCRRRAWDGGGVPGHDGVAHYVFIDAASRERTLPVLETFCDALRGLVGGNGE